MAKKKKNTIKITHTDAPATEQAANEEVSVVETTTDDVVEQAITTEQTDVKSEEPVAKQQKELSNEHPSSVPLVAPKQVTTEEQKASARASYHPLVEGPSFGKLEYDPNI